MQRFDEQYLGQRESQALQQSSVSVGGRAVPVLSNALTPTFGYANAGNGLFIDQWVNFNIHGRDLIVMGLARRRASAAPIRGDQP